MGGAKPAFGVDQGLQGNTSPVKAGSPKPVAAAAAQGGSFIPAAEDHVHALDTASITAVPVQVGVTNAAGAATTISRSDHVHAMTASAPSTGNFVKYNGTIWVPSTIALDDLSDVVITTPASAQVVRYNGSAWVNAAPLLDDCSDVTLTSPTTNHIIAHNGTVWVNGLAPYIVCTSATRPTGAEGRKIYETDTNLEFIHDGSSWVQLTPEWAQVITDQGTTSTSYTNLATVGPTVSVETGTKALVRFGALMYQSGGGQGSTAFAVSGATTRAATDDEAIYSALTASGISMAREVLVTGLTAGTNSFTLKHRTTSNTAQAAYRWITVESIP